MVWGWEEATLGLAAGSFAVALPLHVREKRLQSGAFPTGQPRGSDGDRSTIRAIGDASERESQQFLPASQDFRTLRS